MDGGLMLVEVIVGVKFTALTTIKNVEVEYFADLVFGVLLEIQGIMPSCLVALLTAGHPPSVRRKLGKLSITAPLIII
jgi:hypothetical protein